MRSKPIRVLTFTSLFPNAQQPLHGLFVSERIQALSRLCELQVVAPVPWVPPAPFLSKRYLQYARIAAKESHKGLEIQHPRFLTIPKLFKAIDGILMALSSLAELIALRRSFPFDIIDAHWAYPDGVAAALLARFFSVPLVLTVRGDDINILPKYFLRRQLIRWALRRAKVVIALSNELKDKVLSLAGHGTNAVVIPNGIDCETFSPGDRLQARRRLGISESGRILLSVGRLHISKGFPLLVEALAQVKKDFPDLRLVIVGESDHEADARPAICDAASRLGISEEINLVGAQPRSIVADWYRASDVFCLATFREGSANVLLEALACGVPCVTTPVGGNPEVVSSPKVGFLVPPKVDALARAISRALSQSWDREYIANHVMSRTWASVAKQCLEQLSQLVVLRTEYV